MNSQLSPLLQCTKLSKRYQNGKVYVDVLHNINFTLQYKDMIAIIGNSGSGKSTLLHLLGGLDYPTSGEVFFEGKKLNDLSPIESALLRNRKLGFIYQFHHLLSDFTVLENVALPLLIGNCKSIYAQKIAHKLLISIGIEKLSQCYPFQLSGGECQRVAIARALINNPVLVLADEPTGNLDQHNANKIFNLLNELNIHRNTAFLIVTHDLELAKKLHHQFKMYNGTLQNINITSDA